MAHTQTNTKIGTHISCKKSVFLFTTLFCCTLLSCTSSKKENQDATKVKSVAGKQHSDEKAFRKLTQLTNVGENHSGNFSNAGTHIAYVRFADPQHMNSQIYVMDLVTDAAQPKSTRVTFSDGSVATPLFFEGTEGLLYSSTTDEDKEYPDLEKLTGQSQTTELEREKQILMHTRSYGFEVYARSLAKNQIRRLKRNKGLDWVESQELNPARLLITTHTENNTTVLLTDDSGRTLNTLTQFNGLHWPSPRWSQQKQLAWLAPSEDNKTQIYVGDRLGKKPTVLHTFNGVVRDLSWHPDGQSLVFSGRLQDHSHYDIFRYHSETSCLERLTYDTQDDIAPTFRPGQEALLFTSRRTGQFQLYLAEVQNTNECLKL